MRKEQVSALVFLQLSSCVMLWSCTTRCAKRRAPQQTQRTADARTCPTCLLPRSDQPGPAAAAAQVLTFVGETRVLAINASDELEEDELPGFDADAQARPPLTGRLHHVTML